MRAKLIAAAALAAFVTPALAAEFFVVQDTSTKRCTIVEQRPTTQTSVVIGDGKVFTTRSEAENAMKTIQVCSTTTGRGSDSSTTTTTTVPAR
jgi:vancomycin permeability regulator SanA